ncbi:MAG: 50S ribosomal protein L15 [Candidatus Omnitrophica bacterium]|nr:50S ribosomal protein L15 [Candidatus Omnitrophota bacterium]MBU1869191.1 50S ribosomal protein L15 [Candidatus Omnitrophota bacterium]
MEKKIIKAKKVLKETIKEKKEPRPKVKIKKPEGEVKLAGFGLFNLATPKGAHKKRKYLGRGSGSGHGKTSTRGSKGQTSRAGRHFYLGFEGGQSPLIRKMPKRGFTSNFKKIYQIVNLSDLNKIKETTISLALLEEKGLIENKEKLVKVLGDGEIKNAVTVQAHAFSRKASESIKAAGGKTEIVNV